MPIGWSGSGVFSNSQLTDNPNASLSRTSLLGTIPAGSYGLGARLLIVCAARTGSEGINGLVSSLSGGAFTQYLPPGLPDAFFTAPDTSRVYYLFARVIEPSGWSFDAGTGISITSQEPTSMALAGTVNGASGSPNLVGSGTSFTTALVVGEHVGTFSTSLGRVLSITDDTHLTLDTNLPFTLSGVQLWAHGTEAGAWIAALVTFDPALATPPDGAGKISSGLGSGGAQTEPLMANGAGNTPGPWSVHSVTGTFGGYEANGILSMDQYLTSPSVGDLNCNDAIGMLFGTGTDGTPPYTPDLVSGNANWAAIGGASSTPAWPGDEAVYAALGHWTRPSPYDTSFDWTSFPATDTGFGCIEIFPRNPTPPVGRSYGTIIG